MTRALLGAAPALGTSAVRKSDLTASNITGLAVGANPTALVGLAAINGVSTSWMRADAAPALDVTIAPTWTGAHSWTVAGTATGLTVNLSSSAAGFYTVNSGSGQCIGLYNTGASTGPALYINAAGTGNAITVIAGATSLKALNASNVAITATASIVWQFDFTGGGTNTNNVTLTNGATLTLPVGSGLVYVFDNSGNGMCVAYLVFGLAYVTNIVAALFTNTNGTTGKINIYFNGSNAYLITNNTGSTYTLCVSTLRLRSLP